MTQRRLAALAGVSPPTVSRFEQNRQDIQLSSALAVLGVLGMIERKHEGFLHVEMSGQPGYVVTFAPNEGSGFLEPKRVPDQDGLQAFWSELGVDADTQRLALASLIQSGSATIPNVLLTRAQARQYWPNQKFR